MVVLPGGCWGDTCSVWVVVLPAGGWVVVLPLGRCWGGGGGNVLWGGGGTNPHTYTALQTVEGQTLVPTYSADGEKNLSSMNA